MVRVWKTLLLFMVAAPPLASSAEEVAAEAESPARLASADELLDVLAIAPGDLWSLQPIARAEPPPVEGAGWVTNPIDRFVRLALEQKGLEPAPEASKQTLIRRLYFDLWGLPPEPEAVRDFLDDTRDDAYERLVDRLLASHHFGERWGRHWLDLVRFAETNGYERDAVKPFAWKYRDWVIDAFNRDKPYDRFLTEQLAGDELPDADESSRIATGFLRIGTFDDEPNDPLQYKYEQWDDLIDATFTTFQALTVRCARCHDHKYDPIAQQDYYALLNCFAPGTASEGEYLGYTDSGPNVAPVHLLLNGDPRREAQQVPPAFPVMLPQLRKPLEDPTDDAATTQRRLQLAQWMTEPTHPLTARVIVNRLWQHHFGEGLVRTPDNFGIMGHEPTHPELLDWLASELIEGGWRMKRIHRTILLSSTYRQASVHPRHDDYATRDAGNELLWHFRRRRLEAEALRDAMLAVSGRLNRRVGGPSFFPPVSADALEGLSKKGDAWGESSPEEQARRSIYMFTKRSLLLPLMTTFDFGTTTRPCGQRDVTISAPQALALLNNEFVHEQSTALAERLVAECGEETAAQIERAWWLTLSRAPAPQEQQAAGEHLREQAERFAQHDEADIARRRALASLCHVLLNTNEFLYVD